MRLAITSDSIHPHLLRYRARAEQALRTALIQDGFLELRTSTLVPSPGVEAFIRPFCAAPLSEATPNSTQASYLSTSPELLLKRILCHARETPGLEKVFSLTPAFRSEPISPWHRPEFTLLEWYRTGERAFAALPADVLALAQSALRTAQACGLHTASPRDTDALTVQRFSISDLFEQHFQIRICEIPETKDVTLPTVQASTLAKMRDACRTRGFLPHAPEQQTWDHLYFLLWLNVIEPTLPKKGLVSVEGYPPSQATLARLSQDPQGRTVAQRFEIYWNGVEIANAFDELQDVETHLQRHAVAMHERAQEFGDTFGTTPLDEDFLEALTSPGLPRCAGIALGVERLLAVAAGLDAIHPLFAWNYAETGGS